MNIIDKNSRKLRNASKHLMMQDINTIYNIATHPQFKKEDTSVFTMGILPYLTACVDSAIELMKKAQIDFSNFSLLRDYALVMTKTRAKIKMYRERAGKNINIIENIRVEKNEEFEQMLRFPFLNQINANYDLGTYLLDGQYIGNTFLYEWFFDEIKRIETENPHFDFSYALGEATGYIKNMRKTNKRIAGDFDFGTIRYKDYNITHRPNELFISGFEKGHCLFLFNLLCQTNFAVYYLDRILSKTNSFSIRTKYLIYYFVCSSVRSLDNYCTQNKKDKILDSSTLQDVYELCNEGFCNSMRHYEIINATFLDVYKGQSDELDALVECFFSYSKQDFVDKLNSHLGFISNYVAEKILLNRNEKGNLFN